MLARRIYSYRNSKYPNAGLWGTREFSTISRSTPLTVCSTSTVIQVVLDFCGAPSTRVTVGSGRNIAGDAGADADVMRMRVLMLVQQRAVVDP